MKAIAQSNETNTDFVVVIACTEKNGGVNDRWMTSKWGDGRVTTGNEGEEAMRNQKESSEENKKKV